ncbi:ubiquinone/menaquinone biosynthesis C-methylase UbiE [Aquimarina sp. MAR_2010_214]|uniref:methyltransferase domain-containing protein n=1 Tax=Aquimarina sp. MAR_2010_214 TaxID=1250026 RepID=UPI000C704307|nr:methyltransferase domain-containing protein [Aquimarina sp. MAR_2010_214]PKV51316.1 ubiquinone/menaquinone biosynthesis C-methylase UbiE [Aquimarina sp. MAR_2010_214]
MLTNLQHRSNEVELMDNPEVEEKALQLALSDISRANKWLGGNAITINAVHRLVRNQNPLQEITILDLGCGDGEMLRAVADSFRKEKKNTKLVGIDLNSKCLDQAIKLSTSYPEISFFNKDILEMEGSEFSCDIIICTLTLHHLRDEEIKKVLKKAVDLARTAVVINDLHRSTLAYYLFKVFSFFFIKGYVAKNDGLVSIKRGFKKQELLYFAKALHLQEYKIDWKWAFRYRWVVKTTSE